MPPGFGLGGPSRPAAAADRYRPNYWQWFSHHRNHHTLPPEIAHCQTQLDLIKHLALDVFSRNVYCDQQRCWYGGLAETVWDGVEVDQREDLKGEDRIIQRRYRTRAGVLEERQRYVFRESTLVQEKFLVDDYTRQLDALEEILQARSWRFDAARYHAIQGEVGEQGVVIAGELHCPLKMLHLMMGPEATTYLLVIIRNGPRSFWPAMKRPSWTWCGKSPRRA